MMPININCKFFAFDGKCNHQAAPRKVLGAARCIVWEFHVSAHRDPRISEPPCALMVKRWRPNPSSKIQSSASLLDVATGKIPHLYTGLCPDSVNGPESRDPDCPACQAIALAEIQLAAGMTYYYQSLLCVGGPLNGQHRIVSSDLSSFKAARSPTNPDSTLAEYRLVWSSQHGRFVWWCNQ